jgi:hypothetical protein
MEECNAEKQDCNRERQAGESQPELDPSPLWSAEQQDTEKQEGDPTKQNCRANQRLPVKQSHDTRWQGHNPE